MDNLLMNAVIHIKMAADFLDGELPQVLRGLGGWKR